MESWQKEITLPPKPQGMDYGYKCSASDEPVWCTREELVSLIEKEDSVQYAAVPHSDSLILPGMDETTAVPLLAREKKAVESSIKQSIIFIAVTSALILCEVSILNMKIFMLIFGVLPMLSALFDWFQLQKNKERGYAEKSLEVQFSYWLGSKRLNSLYAFVGVIVFLALYQCGVGLDRSIVAAGLVKPDVFNGEYWRLFTGPLLHGGFLHILFNASAMYVLAQLLIRITDLFTFSLVLLYSALWGSICSLYFIPEQTSVGISGGLLGLIAFLAIFCLKNKKGIPRSVFKSMVTTIVLISILGVALPDLIDNAAHAGGFLGGTIMGLCLIRSNHPSIPCRPSKLVRVLGFVSLAILVASAICALCMMLRSSLV